jgi:hypothetical protein
MSGMFRHFLRAEYAAGLRDLSPLEERGFNRYDKLMVFDVWTSQAAFDKFGKTLMPILQ